MLMPKRVKRRKQFRGTMAGKAGTTTQDTFCYIVSSFTNLKKSPAYCSTQSKQGTSLI